MTPFEHIEEAVRIDSTDKSFQRLCNILQVRYAKFQGFFQQRLMFLKTELYSLLTTKLTEAMDPTMTNLADIFETLEKGIKRC